MNMKSVGWHVLGGVVLPVVALLAGCGGGGGGGGGGDPDFGVVWLAPTDGSKDVSQDVEVYIEANEAIDDLTIVSSIAFIDDADGSSVEAVLRRPNSKVIQIDPVDRLRTQSRYRITIETSLRSTTGRTLGQPIVLTFETVTEPTPKIPEAEDFVGLANAMSSGRSQHTATLLDDGTVLVAGGFSRSDLTTATADLYDHETRSFAPTLTPMERGRARHTATKLLDGRVLIVGGVTGAGNVATAACILFDPASGTFSPAAPLSIARGYHTATLLADGRVLVCGGSTTTSPGTFIDLGTAEIYHPPTGSWSAPLGMLRVRAFHTATRLLDGRVLIAGGAQDTAATIFDPESSSFSPTGGTMQARRAGHVASLLENGNVMMAGGGHDRGEVYVHEAGVFLPLTSVITDRSFGTASPVPEGGVLVLGGILFGDQEAFLLGSMELFAARSGAFGGFFQVSFQLDGPPRAGHTATVLPDGKVLFTGGINLDFTEPELDTGFTYDPK